jgi:ABC-2 type transport system ATP-binding protein
MMKNGRDRADPAIVVSDLRVVRGGRVALQDVSLSVERGIVTGMLGPSGGGKSTLMRAIVGVQVVTGGSVQVLGEPAGSRGLRERVGYMTQAPSVYADLTVLENLRYFAAVLGAPASDAERVVQQVALTDHADALVGRLSGGQEARVSLAVALLGSPELLVLDEPTVGLDPVLRRDLWELFNRLADDGVTLLISSHVMDEAARCQRLVLLREGRVLSEDEPSAILSRTESVDIEQAFLRLVDSAGGSTGSQVVSA